MFELLNSNRGRMFSGGEREKKLHGQFKEIESPCHGVLVPAEC